MIMTKVVPTLAAFLLITAGCRGQDVGNAPETVSTAAVNTSIPEPDSATSRLFQESMAFAERSALHELPIGRVMTDLGERFLSLPYAAGLLDEPARETLVCPLNRFDCVTFVESMLAMARAVKGQQYEYDTWARYMLEGRYRGGEMDGYCSRLHYFSEWIRDNERRGIVENVTERIGGIPLEKTLDFMSTHRSSYPRFAEDDSLYRCIQDMERSLRGDTLYYLPQDRIAEAYGELKAGDIVATATHIDGLDVTHTGLVYDSGDGAKGLLHASTSGGVKVSPDLQSYVEGVDIQIGIIVARPLEPAPGAVNQ